MTTDAVDLLTRLVGIPSLSGEEGEAVGFLKDWMAEHGLEASIDGAGNAVGTKGDGEREILLLGHIDTVAGQIPIQMDGDDLYGRGTVDAKGPLCAFAVAASMSDPPTDLKVTVVGAVEEESATSKGARFVVNRYMETGSPPPTYCVIGEPSRWNRVTLGYKGRLLMDVAFRQPLAHSAGPDKLPPERAVDLWLAVLNHCGAINEKIESEGVFNRLDPSLRMIASRDDGAYGVVEMSLGFRLPPVLEPDELAKELEDLAIRSVGEKASCRFSGAEKACKSGKSNPLVRAFLATIRAERGTPRFVVKTGTSDMNVIAQAWPDMPILAYGPGDSSLDHTPQEHVGLWEYLRTIRVLTQVLNGGDSLFPRNPFEFGR